LRKGSNSLTAFLFFIEPIVYRFLQFFTVVWMRNSSQSFCMGNAMLRHQLESPVAPFCCKFNVFGLHHENNPRSVPCGTV
ncbi:hypothetical protein, partial [Parvibaculum sp.]|uniref:hypothetical protein n=1 Tax=Parvibaculum sp. TaxID=2024848 RepID=UPI0032EF65D9